MTSCPLTGDHWGEPGSGPSIRYLHTQTRSFQVFSSSDWRFPQFHLTQQTPQSLLAPACPCLVPGMPGQDPALQMCEQKGSITTSFSLLVTLPGPALEAGGFFPHKDRLLVTMRWSRPFSRAVFPAGQAPARAGVIPAQVQHPAFLLDCCDRISPACWVPLKGSTTIWCRSCSSGLCITCKAAEGELLPQERTGCCSQHRLLGWITVSCLAFKPTNYQVC